MKPENGALVWDEKSDEDREHDREESLETSTSTGSEESLERGTWGHPFEFILAIVGYSVAFGNLMRFPYLCMRNGGGAFLIPFFLFLISCAFPLYYLEVCLGQFSGSSPLFVWRLAPLLRGIGLLMILISGIVSWYYNAILAWVLYYLFNSFRSTLPWSTCDNPWNTPACRPSDPDALRKLEEQASMLLSLSGLQNGTALNTTLTSGYNGSLTSGYNGTSLLALGNESVSRNISSAKEFWQNNVLVMSSGIEETGSVQWHLVLSLFGAWFLVFLCLIKGIKSVGKVVYVTALLPYVLLLVFLVRGLTLPGAFLGIRYFVTPDFERLKDSQVWLEAAVQVFYSLGPTWGGVITMASFNKFTNNGLRDSIIACLADGLTSFFAGFVVFSVIGYMAHTSGQPIDEVATAGPGMMFIAYPEAISQMPLPQLWAVLFFIMMITVGLDTQFGMFETLASGIVDAFPRTLRKRKTLVTAALCTVMFLLGLVFTTRSGIYIYNLVDWYSSGYCMCLGAALELLAVGWYYGADRFSEDMRLMFGYGAPVLLRVCWCIVAPLVLLVVFLMIAVGYKEVTYEHYRYPAYAVAIGNLLAVVPVMPIPICFVYGWVTVKGSLSQRFAQLMKPLGWRPSDRKLWESYEQREVLPSEGPLDYARTCLVGRRRTDYQLTAVEFRH
ncbi:sodium- and chloride-dependent GABA transporter 1-like isoform X2 [Mya arenaria]|uniref:sodium- and chloride-dependent GABA transporter 1-like isoform X2 n=1 Tax=Mya arenaria TaxID=6604 RepID=UPI0022E2CCB9|nr:sodium- and chloride-dependent GABA transporter 1-like isoform X2 [Mya arenaria]